MNEARVPDNNRNWQEIDIFLFSNGQQNSPPRKYHLQPDELRFWKATIEHLARLQYGFQHSTVELYTLDGKKIESPLELIDAATYVAVDPPNAFIPAGYEQYLIKASRSWEKRQEKLNNNTNTTGETEINKDQYKTIVEESKYAETTAIPFPPRINERKDQDILDVNNTINSRPRKENESSLGERPSSGKAISNKKSVDSDKIKGVRKLTPQISKMNSRDDSLYKKRNISVPKNYKHSTSRRQSVPLKIEQAVSKINSGGRDSKEKLQTMVKNSEDTEVKDTIDLSKPEDSRNENQSQEISRTVFDKGILVISDVYKNPESEVQSVFIDADRKITTRDYPKEKLKSNELQKIIELEEALENTIKANKAISTQSVNYSNARPEPEITASFASKGKVFNIKLNIELRDTRDSLDAERSGHLTKCKPVTEFKPLEQESQTNIDINLDGKDLKTEDICLDRKSMYSKTCSSEINDAKVITVKCGLLETNNRACKSKENYIIFVPATFVKENVECSNCKHKTKQSVDKDVLKHQPVDTNDFTNTKSIPTTRENSQVIIKHKVSISPDSPIKISAEKASVMDKGGVDTILRTVPTRVNMGTQTEWCNVLLQARGEGQGSNSFHLPPLHVLAQYNLL